MIIPGSVRRRFDEDEIALELLSQKVFETVSRYCLSRGFAIAGRRKDCGSLAEKFETGRYSKWSEVDDMYGCKIIVPTLIEEQPTLEFLKRVFSTVDVRRRGSSKKRPDVFRFDATRFIGRLRHTDEQPFPAEYGISFEVQILTAFEHAWSTTTHALAYKSGDLDWKTQRIASQLRASVEQLDMIILGAAEVSANIAASQCPELDEKIAIQTGFQSLISEGLIPEEVAPDKWSRFCENTQALLNAGNIQKGSKRISQLLNKCRLKAKTYSVTTFPRLVSLHQFILGTLIETGDIRFPLKSFTPLITDELRHLFSIPASAGDFQLDE